MTYDDADQLLTSENPIGGVTTFTYTDRGAVATVTNDDHLHRRRPDQRCHLPG